MKERFKMFRRGGGIYYARDTVTRGKQSLGTTDRAEAARLLAAKNQAVEQPALNRGMAKVYLSAASPEFATRTWADVMEHYIKTGVESTRDRKARVFRSRPFAVLRSLKLIDTEALHLLNIIEHKQTGNSTHHYLRRLHNFALYLGWLVSPVMAEAAWPTIRKQKFTAITEEEHERIIAREGNAERKLYYQMLWETGGSQTDIASLTRSQVNSELGVIRFNRRKLMGKDGGQSMLRIGPRMQALLDQLPQQGALFPTFQHEDSKHRSTEFYRRCKTLGIQGRCLLPIVTLGPSGPWPPGCRNVKPWRTLATSAGRSMPRMREEPKWPRSRWSSTKRNVRRRSFYSTSKRSPNLRCLLPW